MLIAKPRRLRATHEKSRNKMRLLKLLVGATGFEPTTSCSQSKHSTRLSYAPNAQDYTCFFTKRKLYLFFPFLNCQKYDKIPQKGEFL